MSAKSLEARCTYLGRLEMARIAIPPLKAQGIKSKLVPTIRDLLPEGFEGRWIEPFMGTGVVGFNLAPGRAIMADANPHIIDFYQALAQGVITAETARDYLEREGALLNSVGESHYYAIRERFNSEHDPFDFLFLSRAGFNGMMRFNRKGQFNIPFCRKPSRFSRAYVTKIVNQVGAVANLVRQSQFEFVRAGFAETIARARPGDIIYCDPPYIDRHVVYFNGWSDEDERRLFDLLTNTPAEFILSTWSGNEIRTNKYLDELWSDFEFLEREHFYHVGGAIENRRAMTEAIVFSAGLKLPEARVIDLNVLRTTSPT